MLEPITTVDVVKIHREIKTKGSAPLFVNDVNSITYFAKAAAQRNPSFQVINELLCAYLAKCWSLRVPAFCLINIPAEVVDTYLANGSKFSDHYTNDFYKTILFGSKELSPVIEIEAFIEIKNRKDIKQFSRPLDFLKIAAFDLWIGNRDRRPGNPNTLIGHTKELFEFHPIDHVAAFAYLEDYNDIRDILLRIECKDCLLSTVLAKTIRKFASTEDIKDLITDIEQSISVSINQMDFIIDQIPPAWGLSKRAKSKVKAFFEDSKRNKDIVERFLSYIKL